MHRTGVLIILAFSVSLLLPIAPAWAPPLYDELDNVIVVDGTVTDGTMEASIDGKSGDTVLINAGLTLAGGTTELSQVKLTLTQDVSCTIRITEIDPPADAPPNAIAFFRVDLDGCGDADINDVEMTIKVNNKFVSVRLYRLSDGTWGALDTSRVETGKDSSTYSAKSPGFSDFAIVAQEGEVQATNPDALPFTSGSYLYVVGLLGVVLLGTGATIRIRAAKE